MRLLETKTIRPSSLSIMLFLICTIYTFTNAQEVKKHEKRTTAAHHFYEDERPDDPYIHIAEADKVKSPPFTFSSTNFSITQVNVDANGNNIIGDAANEPSLAIDPTNPNRMAIGWRQFGTITSNFRQAGVGYSEDGGVFWQYLDPIEADVFRSDPVLDTDSDGNFYYNSLRSTYECDVFKTDDLSTWEDKTFAIGGDKQWMVIDKTGLNSNGHIYAFWKEEFSACLGGSFTRSTDEGITYEDCVVVTDNPTRGTLAIGPDGELYACGGWFDTFKVLKSTTAKDPAAVVQWEENITVDLKGEQALYAGPNPNGMLGQVWVATDYSIGPNYGNVYLLSSVKRSDNTDPADMMFSRSTDQGLTWSEAIPINTDNNLNNWQWFGSMSVAPNGRIDVTWLDTRDDPGTVLSALYYSYSIDRGLTWSENERLSDAFDPHLGWPNQNKIGDYYHMISYDEGAHLAWSATFNGEQDIYYSFIEAPEDVVSVAPEVQSNLGLHIAVYPNPIKEETTIHISSKTSEKITLTVCDLFGRTIGTIADQVFAEGSHNLGWYPTGLASGTYYLKAESESGEQSLEKLFVLSGGL